MTYSHRSALLLSKQSEEDFDAVCETLKHAPLGMPIHELVNKTGLSTEVVTAVVRAALHSDWVDIGKKVLLHKDGDSYPVRTYKFTRTGERMFHRKPSHP